MLVRGLGTHEGKRPEEGEGLEDTSSCLYRAVQPVCSQGSLMALQDNARPN